MFNEIALNLACLSFDENGGYFPLRGTHCNEGFLLNAWKTVRLSTVLLDLKKCILSGAIKFLSMMDPFDHEAT